MTRKEKLQQERNDLQTQISALQAKLDATEKALINAPAEELDRDDDGDDSAFVEELRRRGKLTDKSNLI